MPPDSCPATAPSCSMLSAKSNTCREEVGPLLKPLKGVTSWQHRLVARLKHGYCRRVTQIQVTYYKETSVKVTWVTGESQMAPQVSRTADEAG